MKEKLVCAGGYLLAASLWLLLFVAVAELSARDGAPCVSFQG